MRVKVTGRLYNKFVKVHRSFVFLVILALLAGSGGIAYAQQSDVRYFSETGHTVRGDFLIFYSASPHATRLYGYPITEQLVDPKSGRVVQYFQKVRFEHYPENQPGKRVLLSPLGQYLYTPGFEIVVNPNTPACRYFDHNGKAVCYLFLDFFNQYGGVEQFGYPISGFEIYGGRIVQYFERARFEWYPELAEGERVVVAELGRSHFDFEGMPPSLLSPFIPSEQIGDVLFLRIGASTNKGTVRPDDDITVYVGVLDQTWRPLGNASAVVTVTYPDGRAETQATITDGNGVAKASFRFNGLPPGGRVVVTAVVTYRSLTSITFTSFSVFP